jgi:hypothetical protein
MDELKIALSRQHSALKHLGAIQTTIFETQRRRGSRGNEQELSNPSTGGISALLLKSFSPWILKTPLLPPFLRVSKVFVAWAEC